METPDGRGASESPESRAECAKKVSHHGAAVAAFWLKSDRKNPLAIDSGIGHKVPTPALPDGMRV
ncbi:MAG: hypothetical protein ABS35_30300 [Kaistia sp. SCN 65-12]|nr:MAG: hypothetical protein ABS35_30300 [Kaistia sp. SCN 65-12]